MNDERPRDPDANEGHHEGDRAIDFTAYALPRFDLDPVVRMRALAAGLPHAAANEALFDLPFATVWNLLTDFERGTPSYEGLVTEARVLERRASSFDALGHQDIVLETRGPFPGPWMRFEVVLRPGWCLMSSRLGQVGMAARAEGEDRTRFFHFEGSHRLGRIARPFFAWNIRQDFRRLRRIFASPSMPPSA